MPIQVRHEPGLGGLAALAVLAGAAGARPQTVAAPRAGGYGGGGRGVGGIGESLSQQYVDWMARQQDYEHEAQMQQQQAALESQLQAREIEQRKEAELELKKQEQISEAWVYEYTPQQRQKLAQNQNRRDYVSTRIGTEFTIPEAQQILAQLDQEDAVIIPGKRPKTTQEQQMEAWTAEGKGIGQEWLDEWGNVKTRKPDGEIVTQVPYKDTRAGIEAKRDQELQDAWYRAYEKTKDLMVDIRDATGKKTGERPATVKDRIGATADALGMDNPITQRMIRQLETQEAVQRQATDQIMANQPQEVIDQMQGLKTDPSYAAHPPQVARALAILNTWPKKPPKDPQWAAEWHRAQQIIREYRATGGPLAALTPEKLVAQQQELQAQQGQPPVRFGVEYGGGYSAFR